MKDNYELYLGDNVEVSNKHKYAYVLGKDKKETKVLRRKFLDKNKIYDYSKVRGE